MRRGSRASPSKRLPNPRAHCPAVPNPTPVRRYSVRVAGVGLKKMLLDAEQKKVLPRPPSTATRLLTRDLPPAAASRTHSAPLP
eukprot:COSAG04_NODE_5016_length_1780_cov_1.374182_1_plen_83_part_10